MKPLKLLGLLVLLILASCKDFKEAEVTGVQGFKIKKANMDGIEAIITLGVKNPNDIGFSIYPSEFDVTYGGMNLGKARLSKRVHIDAHSEKPYDFVLKSSLKNLNIMDLTGLLGGKKSGSITLKGDLKAGKFYLKKRFPVNVNEKMKPDF